MKKTKHKKQNDKHKLHVNELNFPSKSLVASQWNTTSHRGYHPLGSGALASHSTPEVAGQWIQGRWAETLRVSSSWDLRVGTTVGDKALFTPDPPTSTASEKQTRDSNLQAPNGWDIAEWAAQEVGTASGPARRHSRGDPPAARGHTGAKSLGHVH